MKYRPEIDGLRAVAVIPVVLFHMGMQWIPGGYVGVDIFFVISGYLITSIILGDYNEGRFSFVGFWHRRARRILPALLVMLLITSVAGYRILFGSEINNLGREGIAAALSFANIRFWRATGDYWGPQAESSPLLHTWSLSAEEQFYFLYPVFLFLLLRYARKWVPTALALVTIGGFALYLYGSAHFPTATFYLIPMRAWELASGCAIAVYFSSRNPTISPRWASILTGAGLAAIACTIHVLGKENRFPGDLIIPVAGTLLVVAFANHATGLAKRFLTASPVVYTGKISYSLYLWHWPILLLARSMGQQGQGHYSEYALLPGIGLAAMASYHFVEKTTRNRKNIIIPILLALVVSVAGSAYLSRPENVHEDISYYAPTVWSGEAYNASPRSYRDPMRMAGMLIKEPSEKKERAYATGGILRRYGGETPDVVVLGDSHALMWAGVIDEICREMGKTVSFYAADGTPAFFEIPVRRGSANMFFTVEEKQAYDMARLQYLKQWRPKIVIIATRWSGVKGLPVTRDLMDYIGQLGSRIVLIEQPPELAIGDKNTPEYLSHMGIRPNTNLTRQYIRRLDRREYEVGRELIRTMAGTYPRCNYVETADIFLHGEDAWVLDGDHVLYIDDDHLSDAGAAKVKDRIAQKIIAALGE